MPRTRRQAGSSSSSTRERRRTTAGASSSVPTAFLYIGIGDGEFPGDPNEVAQDRRSLLGKIRPHRPARPGRFGAPPVPHPDRESVRRPARARRDLVAWASQPVGLLVRSPHGRPLDRRPRRSQPRGGRPRASRYQTDVAPGRARTSAGTTARASSSSRRTRAMRTSCAVNTSCPSSTTTTPRTRARSSAAGCIGVPARVDWRGLYVAGDHCGRLFALGPGRPPQAHRGDRRADHLDRGRTGPDDPRHVARRSRASRQAQRASPLNLAFAGRGGGQRPLDRRRTPHERQSQRDEHHIHDPWRRRAHRPLRPRPRSSRAGSSAGTSSACTTPTSRRRRGRSTTC